LTDWPNDGIGVLGQLTAVIGERTADSLTQAQTETEADSPGGGRQTATQVDSRQPRRAGRQTLSRRVAQIGNPASGPGAGGVELTAQLAQTDSWQQTLNLEPSQWNPDSRTQQAREGDSNLGATQVKKNSRQEVEQPRQTETADSRQTGAQQTQQWQTGKQTEQTDNPDNRRATQTTAGNDNSNGGEL